MYLYFSPSLVVVHLVPLVIAELMVVAELEVKVRVAVRYYKDNEPSTNEL